MGEDRTSEVTSLARPPKVTADGVAVTIATEESSPGVETSLAPSLDNSIPFTSKNLVPDFPCIGILRFAGYYSVRRRENSF